MQKRTSLREIAEFDLNKISGGDFANEMYSGAGDPPPPPNTSPNGGGTNTSTGSGTSGTSPGSSIPTIGIRG